MARPAQSVRAGGGDGVRLRILGPLRLWRDGVERGAGPQQQAKVLALLLARAGRPISTTDLIDLIWEEDAPASALNVIQKYVGVLRRLLEPEVPARASGSYLLHRGNAYLFSPHPGTLDLTDFRERLAAARSTSDAAVALDHHLIALGLWQGHAGAGLPFGPAATAILAGLDDEFYAACVAAADLALRVGRPDRVVPAVQLASSMAPFHEPVQAALVTVLGAAGRQAEALAAFGTIRDRLAAELGIDPGPALRAAHLRVLTQPDAPAPRFGTAAPPAPADDRDRAGTASGSAASGSAGGLVGRDEEIGVLRRAVEAALGGGVALRVVEGEPGVGKTRLLEEIATEAGRRGALAVWGRCLEGDGTPAMWPWEQTLRAILDTLPAPDRASWLTGALGDLLDPRGADVAPATGGGRAQFRLFEQAVTFIGRAAADRPVLLVLDDLQWADIASLQLFGHLAGRLPAGTAMVGALRDRAPVPGSGLSRVLADAGRLPFHRRMRLGPLGESGVAELVRRETGSTPAPDIVRDIHERTGGNPFFVREVARLISDGNRDSSTGDGGDSSGGSGGSGGSGPGDGGGSGMVARAGVPATVRDVVRGRMAGLDDGARDLLRLAALIGRDVEVALLARAAGLEPVDCLARLEPLRGLGLLEASPDDAFAWRFAHDLVRESVTETTAGQDAVRLHLRVADALERSRADDESIIERLAFHLLSAGPLADPVRTVEALKRAGRRAATKLAFAAADRHLETAGRIARTAGLPELELSALSLLAIAPRRQAGFGGTTSDLLERAELLARRLGREADAAGLLFARLFGAYTFLDPDRGHLARRLYAQGEASTLPVVRVYGRQALGLHHWDVGAIGEARRLFASNDLALLDTAPAQPNGDPEPGGPGSSVPGPNAPGHGATAVRRDVSGEWPGWRAVVTALHGEVDTAVTMIDEWNAPTDPYAVGTWAYYTTMIAALAGDPGRVLRAVERWFAMGTGHLALQQEHYVRLDWFWARALTGEDEAGVAAEAETLLAATLVDPPRFGVAFHHALIAEMWLAAGKPDAAGTALDRAERALDDYGQRYAEGLVLLLRARLLHARGEPAGVVEAAAGRARDRSRERGAHLFAARAESFLLGL
ncbi:DNA-binding SARP family transcriptional activator [Catenuloplanes nepalensis]|uniref:DNA-binding SARP family transcriptional activator n=1 Tax=Catenuloplanes nepalensis TaxID=587533 RepID=A0ABT9MXS1_9ACTN|nr:AAA family ATPase [Catenuloplanes nepalensis]MDP9796185.1 DNA-binding SARP family transcriptional activator [Catenuloplanes nepalensis]